jgi:hypothetical protein
MAEGVQDAGKQKQRACFTTDCYDELSESAPEVYESSAAASAASSLSAVVMAIST